MEWCWEGVGVHVWVQSGVYKRMGERVVSGFLVPVVLGFIILREYLGTLGRGTTVPIFRVQRGSLGSPGTGCIGCPWLCRARINWRSESSICVERCGPGVGDLPGAAGEG